MEKKITSRGFQYIEFSDQKGQVCSIQESSLYYPCVWIGLNDASPMIMASKAQANGIPTKETTGWINYPIPDDVSISTRMHLDKRMLRKFIDTLEEYYSEMPDFEEEE